jgi:SAM-dependent methyltransferase
VVRREQDAFGHVLYDYLRGVPGANELIERDDGWIGIGAGPEQYFAEFRRWPSVERQGIRYVRGRTLDVGCGAGRVALHLQERGHEVVGIDNSPLAVKVCRERGVKQVRLMPFANLSESLGTFETILMYGVNFGLFESASKAKRLLRRLWKLTTADARIVAQSRDPYETEDPLHLAYHRKNRRRGKMAGQLRLRVRYRTYVSPWFDYLIVSEEEMADILIGTGWQIRRTIGDDVYVAVIEKETASAVV